MSHGNAVQVIDRYGGARVPFEAELELNETVGTLKAHVLETFRLFEGATTFYDLYRDQRPLENMNETIGRLAGDHHKLELELIKQYHG